MPVRPQPTPKSAPPTNNLAWMNGCMREKGKTGQQTHDRGTGHTQQAPAAAASGTGKTTLGRSMQAAGLHMFQHTQGIRTGFAAARTLRPRGQRWAAQSALLQRALGPGRPFSAGSSESLVMGGGVE